MAIFIDEDTITEVLRFLPLTRPQLIRLAYINRQFFHAALGRFRHTPPYVHCGSHRFLYRNHINGSVSEELRLELPHCMELTARRFADITGIRCGVHIEPDVAKSADYHTLDEYAKRFAVAWQLPRFIRFNRIFFDLEKAVDGADLAGLQHLWSSCCSVVVRCTDMTLCIDGSPFASTLSGYRKQVEVDERRMKDYEMKKNATIVAGSLKAFVNCRHLTIKSKNGRVPRIKELLELLIGGRGPMQRIIVQLTADDEDFDIGDYARRLFHGAEKVFRQSGSTIESESRFFAQLTLTLRKKFKPQRMNAAEWRAQRRNRNESRIILAGQNRCHCKWYSYDWYEGPVTSSHGSDTDWVGYDETVDVTVLTGNRRFWQWEHRFGTRFFYEDAKTMNDEISELRGFVDQEAECMLNMDAFAFSEMHDIAEDAITV